jgi:hypothetical protein
MTGSQLLHELSISLQQTLETLPADSAERLRRDREPEDRSLWSARRRLRSL